MRGLESDTFPQVQPQRVPQPLHLGPVPGASAEARDFVRGALQALGADELIEASELGVSELVANACLHARTPIIVALRVVGGDMVRIEVTDDSPRQPEQRDLGRLATTGRGLRLLASYGEWGVEPVPPSGKKVWFQPLSEPLESAMMTSLDEWPDL
jgi:hypothetical protein